MTKPTTGLDPVTAREISTLIVAIQRKFQTASIVISHDKHCVKLVSDRVALLDGGKCYWQGKYDEMEASGDHVLKQFLNKFTLMPEGVTNNVKLGLFVLAGLSVLILTLYLIGKSQNLFGSNVPLKARFRNVSGLMSGSNVLFSVYRSGQ